MISTLLWYYNWYVLIEVIKYEYIIHSKRCSNSLEMSFMVKSWPSKKLDWNKSLSSSPIPCKLYFNFLSFYLSKSLSFYSSSKILFLPKKLGSLSNSKIILTIWFLFAVVLLGKYELNPLKDSLKVVLVWLKWMVLVKGRG